MRSDQLEALDESRSHFERAANFIENMIKGNRSAHQWAVAEIELCFESLTRALACSECASGPQGAPKEDK
jgi:hypothetical protein